jgi:hypothetical protein
MKFEEIARLPADTLLADELLKDDGIIEMANLDMSQRHLDFHHDDRPCPAGEIFHPAWTNAVKLFGHDRRSAAGSRE